MKIYISSAKKSGNPLNLMAGDTDYVETILRSLQSQFSVNDVVQIEEDLRQAALASGNSPVITGDNIVSELLTKREPGILHIMLNLPFTGSAYKPEDLQKLKAQGYKIVISCIEFLRYVGRDEESQRKAIELINHADQIIFLDTPDQQAAMDFARSLKKSSSSVLLATAASSSSSSSTSSSSVSSVGLFSSASSSSSSEDLPAIKKIQEATIIPVPRTTPTTQTEWSKRPPNVISFGTIRRGKGLPHLVKLAELFQQADEHKKEKRYVIIAGSMEPHFYVEGFSEAMKRIFPKHLDEIAALENEWFAASKSADKTNKDKLVSAVTMKIRGKVTEWQSSQEGIRLPVKFYFDTKPDQVPALFEQAKYSFLPAYRGFTLRNTSISTSLDSGCVTYSHVTNISPIQQPTLGDPSAPVVLIPGVISEFEKNRFFDTFEYADKLGSMYAISVFKDIEQRENDPAITIDKTIPAVKKLVDETISLNKITQDIVETYKKAGDNRLLSTNHLKLVS